MLVDHLPDAQYLLADKAYDADHYRARLKQLRIQPVIPNKSNRKQPYAFDKKRYRNRNVIERMFGRLKDFRRVATRYDKNARNFMAALCLAALICYWIRMSLDPRSAARNQLLEQNSLEKYKPASVYIGLIER
jgi:transposase